MYVFEGLKAHNEPGFSIPSHFFRFQEFHPETMRLKDEEYFQYYEPDPETKKILLGHQREAKSLYRHYLSYDALLQCLELNELADSVVTARIEAHYTFLGKFLHPTNQAARDLHDRANVFNGGTAIGMESDYSKVAVLLASLYVCSLVAGLLQEVANMIETAPPKYIEDAATDVLRNTTARVAVDFPYFWFLFNDPPLYDRFKYCLYTATSEELAKWGHYSSVPKERVTFDQHIYTHLQEALKGWNGRVGDYASPIR